MPSQEKPRPTRSGSHLVAAGILLSRVAGLVRQKIFAHYFGNSDAGDAFYAALKIPNFLQNLLGDGVLSASFIPVYAGMLAKPEPGAREAADRVAGIVGSLLALATSLLVVAGILATPFLIDLIAPGFHGDKRALTIQLVQILFPGTGLVVMCAWCLGILNSHRKFFLSYAAPVIWNAAIIGALFFFGGRSTQRSLAIYASWGVFIGSALQFSIQFPGAWRLAPGLRAGLSLHLEPIRQVFRNLGPVVVARGVVQVSAYVDNVLASLLPMGAVSALAYAQSLYMLPISLFGMSVSAAELPAMASVQGTGEELAARLRERIDAGLRQIAFFVVPSVVGFLALGDVIVAGLYQGGEFTHGNTVYVWGVLAGSTVGLLATTLGRLYSSAFYSLKDTRTPMRYAILRVALTTGLGYLVGLRLPVWVGISPSWGTAGLTASAGIAGWIEFVGLQLSLSRRIGRTGIPRRHLATIWAAALLAGAIARGVAQLVGNRHPILDLAFVLAPYGVAYFGFGALFGLDQSRRYLQKGLAPFGLYRGKARG